MNRLALRYSGVLLLLVTPGLAAQQYDAVKAAVGKLVPSAENIAVAETPIGGLLEVTVDSDIFYVDESGQYLLQGSLYDLEQRRDLTEDARSKLRRQLMAQVKPGEDIVFAGDDVEHDIMVFTDVDCGYCRKLHSQIEEYNDLGIAVHYLSYPRAGVPSESYEKAVSVWCADDRRQAMTEAKLGKTLEKRECENPVQEHFELGRAIGMTGTPAIVTQSGVLIPGYVPPAALKQRLEQLEQQQQTAAAGAR